MAVSEVGYTRDPQPVLRPFRDEHAINTLPCRAGEEGSWISTQSGFRVYQLGAGSEAIEVVGLETRRVEVYRDIRICDGRWCVRLGRRRLFLERA